MAEKSMKILECLITIALLILFQSKLRILCSSNYFSIRLVLFIALVHWSVGPESNNSSMEQIQKIGKAEAAVQGVLRKRCSENMQQIYRRIPMSKCDFKTTLLKSHLCMRICKFAPVNLLHI